MGRVYYVSTGEQTLSAVQDLLEIKAATAKTFKVHEVTISSSYTAIEKYRIDIIRATSGYTSGSGGGTATVTNANGSDASDGFTNLRNNTTQAVAGGGALNTIDSRFFNTLTTFHWYPPAETDVTITPADGLIVALQDTPASALYTCTAVVEEIG